jgi:8-amino-7-oxononanoate synthase
LFALEQWLGVAAAERERAGRVRYADVKRNPETAGDLLDLASNDYLGLAGDPRLAAAAGFALERYGTSARASRVVSGTTAAHEELERELCRLTGYPTALAFSSGYTANLAVLTALGDPETLLITDAHIHASLIDGARLSRSPVAICPHSDIDELARLLADRTQPRAVVVVESIYSVLGDACDLASTAALCAHYDAWLVVDEAHGIGVAGGGRGAVWAAGLAGVGHVVLTVTLSKALGSQGGAVLGSGELRDHLINTARTFIFDTGLAPSAAAAAAAACRVIAADPERVAQLHAVAARIAQAAGIEQAAGAVQSIPVGDPMVAFETARRLHQAGIVVGCFRPPSVPDDISRLRLTARATLDPDAAERAAVAAAQMVVSV